MSSSNICNNCVEKFNENNFYKHTYEVVYNTKCDVCEEDVLFVYHTKDPKISSLLRKYFRKSKFEKILENL